jgi:hypothetical protein
MNRFLSITNLIWPLFALHTAVLAQSVKLPVVRQKGASLDLSVAQEADHAMRLAREWLREHPPANTETQTCALAQLALESAAPSTNLAALAATAGLYAQAHQAEAFLAACITNYPPKQCNPETLWLISRAINQDHQGRLLRNSEPLDWRNDFAQLLITSQRRAPSEGAYWEPAGPNGATISSGSAQPRPPACGSAVNLKSTPESLMTARIRATAYGILALKEIHE